jgi:hypothetical protein
LFAELVLAPKAMLVEIVVPLLLVRVADPAVLPQVAHPEAKVGAQVVDQVELALPA